MKQQCIRQQKELHVARASALNNFNNNSDVNLDNRNLNNHRFVRGIAQASAGITPKMVPQRDLWKELCSYENLELAYKKARKHKTQKDYVRHFEKNLENNLLVLRSELSLHSYRPKALTTFIVRDSKTRKISKSDFRDRIIHHALFNIIEQIFDKTFIYDSYANRKSKGTLKALERFDYFKRKVSKNNTKKCFVLKADIKHYFEKVNHSILLNIIKKRIKDKKIIWLIKQILNNHHSEKKGEGMPLGNLTSQFFANVYLNELDYFAKHTLKAGYYIRYVDDFVVFEENKEKLEIYKQVIDGFLRKNLKICLHPDKTKIFCLGNRINFLGFRVFFYHKLLKKSNLRKMQDNLQLLKEKYEKAEISYDKIYNCIEGWLAYAKNADSYKQRKNLMTNVSMMFLNEMSAKEINRYLKILGNQ